MGQQDQPRRKYPSDWTDEPWAIVGPMSPPATQSPRGGRPRQVTMRAVLPTLFSLHRRGCPWEMLPHDVLPKRPVYDDVVQWRDDGTWATMVKVWRERTRVAAGREPTPSAVCMASPSVKTPAMGGPERGDDGGKQINGRTRHLLVDTLGLWRAVLLPSAGLEEGVAAPLLLGPVHPYHFPRLVTILADQQEPHHALDAGRAAHRPSGHSAVQARPAGTKGFTPVEQRWGMERTHAWHSRCRSNRKDSEYSAASSPAIDVQVCFWKATQPV